MRSRCLFLALFALAALLFAAGCDRVDSMPLTAEVDEPGYRRGKELIRQGRNQEALMEFQKVIEKRGLNNAPEAHLELGLLYQSHIRDPIAAIYHFKKYRELKPSTQQAELVRARIDAAMREFARTLPGNPLENPLTSADNPDVVQRLQRENEQLHAALARMRVSIGLKARPPTDAQGNLAEVSPEETAAVEVSPISASAPEPAFPIRGSIPDVELPALEPSAVTPPTRPSNQVNAAALTQPATRPTQTPTPQTTPPAGGRRHIVKQGEGLWTIARRYYGTPTTAQVDGIYTANRDRMSSKADLKVGMELRIP